MRTLRMRHVASDDKVLVVRDGSVEAHTKNSGLEPKVAGRQRWTHHAEVVQISGAASADDACETPLHQPRAFQQVEFVLRDQDGTSVTLTAAPEGPAAKLHLRPGPISAGWQFVWQGYRYVLKRGEQIRQVKILSISVIWANGTMQRFESPGFLCAEFRSSERAWRSGLVTLGPGWFSGPTDI